MHPAIATLPGLPHPDPARDALAARWLDITRRVLPGMAAEHGWPISLDHCFMRVCLDAAVGRRWDEAVRRPALRHLTAVQLAAAIAVAEEIVAAPHTLPALNAASLRMRAGARAGRDGDDGPVQP